MFPCKVAEYCWHLKPIQLETDITSIILHSNIVYSIQYSFIKQYTVYSIQYTAFYISYTVYCILILYTVYCILYIIYTILHSNIIYSILYSNILYSILHSNIIYSILHSNILYSILYSNIIYNILDSNIIYSSVLTVYTFIYIQYTKQFDFAVCLKEILNFQLWRHVSRSFYLIFISRFKKLEILENYNLKILVIFNCL